MDRCAKPGFWLRHGLSADVTSARALSGNWTCSVDYQGALCTSPDPLAVRASTSFEFVVSGNFSDPSASVNAMVQSLTPDPEPNNDLRYVSLHDAL